jgi:hypothetical protein
VLVEQLSVGELAAARHAARLTLSARLLTALFVGVLTGALAVPARRFAKYDYDLYSRYRRDDEDESEDLYGLEKPKHWLILLLVLDHALPPFALASFVVSRSRSPESSYSSLCIALLVGLVLLRLALARPRFQIYLDGAASAFRDFAKDKTGGVMDAGQRVRVRVLSTHYFLPTVGCMYICPPILMLTLALTAKRGGGLSFGICRLPTNTSPVTLQTFSSELGGFLAWFALFVHSFCSLASLMLDVVLDAIDSPSDKREASGARVKNASTRRRLRRMSQHAS